MKRRKILSLMSPFYFVLYLVLFFGLRAHRLKNFSVDKMETMMRQSSSWKDVTDDPCLYGLHGDPWVEDNQWIKLGFYCGDDQRILSTFSLETLASRKIRNILESYSEIVGLKKDSILGQNSNYRCYVDQKLVTDYESEIKLTNELFCVEKNANLEKVWPKQ